MNDESAVLIQNFQKICLMQRDKLKILKKYAYALKQGANCRSEIFEYLKLDLFNPNRKQEQIRALICKLQYCLSTCIITNPFKQVSI